MKLDLDEDKAIEIGFVVNCNPTVDYAIIALAGDQFVTANEIKGLNKPIMFTNWYSDGDAILNYLIIY